MEGQAYTNRAYKEIYFSNSDVSFDFFYKNMGEVLTGLIIDQNLYKSNKKIFSFIGNFLHAVNTDEKKQEIQKRLLSISRELENDNDIKRLIKYDQQNIDITVPYLKKYYFYFIKQIKLLSYFLSSLDRTYMPTTDLSKSLFKWKNYLQFFNCYISLKQTVTNNLASFSLLKFQEPLNSILIFYYGYNQYITLNTKLKIEKALEELINYISTDDILKLISKEYKTSGDNELIGSIKWKINLILLEIYNQINGDHSMYNIIPKIQKKVYIDSTSI